MIHLSEQKRPSRSGCCDAVVVMHTVSSLFSLLKEAKDVVIPHYDIPPALE